HYGSDKRSLLGANVHSPGLILVIFDQGQCRPSEPASAQCAGVPAGTMKGGTFPGQDSDVAGNHTQASGWLSPGSASSSPRRRGRREAAAIARGWWSPAGTVEHSIGTLFSAGKAWEIAT